MDKRDYDTFCQLIDAAYEMHFKTLSPKAKALFFSALQGYPLGEVRLALSGHVADRVNGRFPPQPAHLAAQIDAMHGGDGRPGPEEAWAMAVLAGDEGRTVVWTTEMRDAFALCRPLLARGDEIGARMAFKDAYVRLCAEAQQAGRGTAWEASLGWDMAQRGAALGEAVRRGRLAQDAVALMFSAHQGDGPLAQALLGVSGVQVDGRRNEGKADERPLSVDARERIAQLRQVLAAAVEKKRQKQADAARRERERIDGLKLAAKEAAETVAVASV